MRRLGLYVMLILLFIEKSFSTSLPTRHDQNNLLESISRESWRRQTIIHQNSPDNNLETTRYLVNSINLRNNFSNNNLIIDQIQRFNRIITQNPYLFNTIGDPIFFWQKRFTTNNPLFSMADVFSGNINNLNNIIFHNNPRQQQRILNYKEIARFNKTFTDQALNFPNTPMISHSNFENDDVIRSLSLSGTFCSYDGTNFDPLFSGMLAPGQPYIQDTFAVHSCLHGFRTEQLNDIYFIPYGIDLTDTNTNQANLDNSFPIQSIWREEACINMVRQNDINGMTEHYPYGNEDYAMVVINGFANRNIDRPLWTVLDDRQNDNLLGANNLFPNFINIFNGTLPTFLGDHHNFDVSFQNFQLGAGELEKYYAIGRPGDTRFKLNNSGFSVVTNLTNDVILNPLQSLRNDPDLFIPHQLGIIPNRIALTFPSAPGMSGGIILKSFSRFNMNLGVWQRIGRAYGTVWGSERLFHENQLTGLTSFVNVIN